MNRRLADIVTPPGGGQHGRTAKGQPRTRRESDRRRCRRGHTPERSSGALTAGDPRRWWVLVVMSLSIFMIFVDSTIVNTAIPSIARDLKASTRVLQWVVDGYTLVLAGLMLAGGTIGDRFGRRRWMSIGLLTFGLASAGVALSDSASTLIAFRALQGAGAALVMPATLSILTDVFPREERAKAIGIWTAAGGLGVGVGDDSGARSDRETMAPSDRPRALLPDRYARDATGVAVVSDLRKPWAATRGGRRQAPIVRPSWR